MLNQAILRGFVADDPYIQATESSKYARVRIATIERVTIQKSGAIREHTEWHTVSMWGELADLADSKIRIGASIEVVGTLRTREWESKKGVMNRTTEIVATKVTILDPIEGYTLPRPIAEKKDILYPPKKKTPSPLPEVKVPDSNPDDLPF